MPSAETAGGGRFNAVLRRLWNSSAYLAVTVFCVGFAVLLQWSAGCYHKELSGYPDEPAHLITGLMISDYVRSGMQTSPMRFAEDYYLHYPKVGFGIWPPLFHFTEAAWFLLIPPSKTSAFVLQALIAGALAGALCIIASRRFGLPIGVGAGLAFIALPVTQTFTAMIMADMLMALAAFLAMIATAAYAREGQRKYALWMGVLLGLALMAKTNAIALALLPPLTIVLLRKYRRLLDPWFWIAGAIAAVLALPWQLLAMSIWTGTVDAIPYSMAHIVEMGRVHVRMYVTTPGPVILVLACIGFYVMVLRPYLRRSLEPIWAAAVSLAAALFLFGFAPLPAEPRYHLASMAVLVLLAAAGANWIAVSLAAVTLSLGWKRLIVAGAAALLFALTTFSIPKRESYGYVETGRALLANPSTKDAVMLVSSENFGEGMLIPEIALLERRPNHYVLRATKMLSRSRWNLGSYELVHHTPDAVFAYLKSIPVRMLIFDETPGPTAIPHHQLLRQMLAAHSADWKLVGTYPSSGPNSAGGRIRVFELQHPAPAQGAIKVDMRYTLRKTLE